MTTGTLKIHSENILPIIKKWLYSEKDIFIRELVSNACDAIHKVGVLRDRGETEALDEEFRIDIKVDKQARTLKFIDTGIGMDASEVEKYIAELAFSGAEEFVEKYSSKEEKDQIIGHFGLGFYSAYMAAKNVEINTLSYKEGAEPVLWSCDGTSEYEIGEGTRDKRGTEITLHIQEGEEEFLELTKLREVLEQYCSFLPAPIYLEDTLINKKSPLWLKSPSDCTDEEYLEFYKKLHPLEPEPLFWVHLNVDYPFHLKGILYFPKIRNDFELKKNNIRLFCNRVFVSDHCQGLMPDYLMMLQGCIDSPDIPLNVSRSYLQMDKTVRQLSSHISKKISDKLGTLYKTDKEKFVKVWKDVEIIVKLGILQDDKFYSRVKECLIWKNAEGESTTIEEYLERNKTKHENKIFYSLEDKHKSQFFDLFKQRGIEVLLTTSPVDIHLISFLEGKLSPAKFQRIDSSIEETLLDKSKEKTLLDAEGKTESGKLADFIRSKLAREDVEVEAKSLASDTVPAFVMIEETSRRMRDYMMATSLSSSQQQMLGKHTFVVNTNNTLVASLQMLDKKNPKLAKELVLQLYELSLLSQKELPTEALGEFINRNNRVLEDLAAIVAKEKEE